MKKHPALWLLPCLFLVSPILSLASSSPEKDTRALLESYVRYLLAEQINAQASGLMQGQKEPVCREVQSSLDAWTEGVQGRIRAALSQQFGGKARTQFEGFVSEFSTAESRQDSAFLNRISNEAGWNPSGDRTFQGLRVYCLDNWIQPDVKSGADLLGEIQTWLDFQGKGQKVPPLSLWLARKEPAGTGSGSPKSKSKPKSKNSLRDAEAAPAEMDVQEEEATSPLNKFASARDDRRQKALEEAQAGMQQVAGERDAWEQENASKKLAAAQTEAEAMKRQAEKLAATDQEALDQRKNSWSAKLKEIAAGTISAGVGGFTGAVGARAADAAVNAIFKER